MRPEDRAILNHMVGEGADAWYDNAVKVLGRDRADQALAQKVAKGRDHYEAAIKRDGTNYKTRAERDLDERRKFAQAQGLSGPALERAIAPAVWKSSAS